MRINEDQFHVLASKARVQATKCGYLYKKSGKKQAADAQTVRLQKRWYVLYYNLLFYYDNESSPKPTGVIIIEGCTCKPFPDNKIVSLLFLFFYSSLASFVFQYKDFMIMIKTVMMNKVMMEQFPKSWKNTMIISYELDRHTCCSTVLAEGCIARYSFHLKKSAWHCSVFR